MDIRFLPFDPANTSPEAWARFHRFRRARHLESRPEDPILDDETIQQAILNEADHPEFASRRFAVIAAVAGGYPDEQVGSFSYGFLRPTSPSYAENQSIAPVQIAVLAPWRRRGIGRRALAQVRDLMHAHGQTVALGSTWEPDGRAFAAAVGAEEALAGRESRLALADVDWAMLDRWIAAGEAHQPRAELVFFDRLPDDIAEPYCALYTETFNQQPLGEMAVGAIVHTPETTRRNEADLAKIGGRRLSAVLRETDGTLSGLTELVWIAGRPTMAQQGLTGVRDAYRGGGKGKWLKAALLRRIKDELPEVAVVTTDNASDNAPMRAINEHMGFKLHHETMNVQIGLAELEAYLGG